MAPEVAPGVSNETLKRSVSDKYESPPWARVGEHYGGQEGLWQGNHNRPDYSMVGNEPPKPTPTEAEVKRKERGLRHMETMETRKLDPAPWERVGWAADERFKILKFKVKFPIARTFELFRARSRLYRS